MADGSVKIDVGLNIGKAEKDLAKLKQKISTLESDLEARSARKSEIEQRMEQIEAYAESARQEVKQLTEEFNNSRGSERAGIKEQLDRARENLREATKESDALGREYQRVSEQIDEGTQNLTEMQEEAGNLAQELEEARPGAELAEQFDNAKDKLKKFALAAVGIKTAVELFKKLKEYTIDAVKEFAEYDEETKNNIQELKDSLQALKLSWGAAFAPIFNAIVPLLQKLISWLTAAANAIARFFALLSGKSTYKKAIANNDNLAESIEGVGGAAAEAQRQLMGFDELNVLNGNSGGGGGGGGAQTGVEVVDMPTEADDNFTKLINLVKKHLDELELAALGAMAGIGLALLLTGHIGLGIGMLIASGLFAKYVIAPKWETIVEKCGGTLGAIELFASGALLGIGLVLALSGANLPLGLGMIAAGALGIAANAALNWNDMPNNVSRTIARIMLIVGGALLAIGLILTIATPAFSPIGLALIALGAAAFVGGVAVDWNSTSGNVAKVLGDILVIAGGALLAMGLILTLTAAAAPLGIAMMIAGAAALVGGVVALNWDWITKKMQGTLGLITTIAGAALLAIGLILTCSGVAIPLGLGMMVAGGFALHTGIANYDWDALKKKLAGVWQGIKDWWNRDVAKFFTKQYWQNKLDEVFGRLNFPHINLPHLLIEWEALPPDSGLSILFGINSLPHLSVQWYAKGGIVDGATLIGAGEAGKEAIVPLEHNTEWITLVADGIMDRLVQSDFANKLADAFMSVPMPAMAGGGVVPRNAAFSGLGGDFGQDILSELAALRSEISALSRQPIEVGTKMYLDRREVGKAVTTYQREQERGRG